jgi:major membrane immunogen (membrane-anchored lipoprotein)
MNGDTVICTAILHDDCSKLIKLEWHLILGFIVKDGKITNVTAQIRPDEADIWDNFSDQVYDRVLSAYPSDVTEYRSTTKPSEIAKIQVKWCKKYTTEGTISSKTYQGQQRWFDMIGDKRNLTSSNWDSWDNFLRQLEYRSQSDNILIFGLFVPDELDPNIDPFLTSLKIGEQLGLPRDWAQITPTDPKDLCAVCFYVSVDRKGDMVLFSSMNHNLPEFSFDQYKDLSSRSFTEFDRYKRDEFINFIELIIKEVVCKSK